MNKQAEAEKLKEAYGLACKAFGADNEFCKWLSDSIKELGVPNKEISSEDTDYFWTGNH